MSTTARFRIEEQAPGVLALSGVIDEYADLLSLIGRAQRGKLVLDLGGITFINSLGVRDWIRLQSAASAQSLRVELQNVAEPLVHQLNMIVATRGSARVNSFFAPFACDQCGLEESLLLDAVAIAPSLAAGVLPSPPCKECGAQMEFDDFPERYFAFLGPSSS